MHPWARSRHVLPPLNDAPGANETALVTRLCRLKPSVLVFSREQSGFSQRADSDNYTVFLQADRISQSAASGLSNLIKMVEKMDRSHGEFQEHRECPAPLGRRKPVAPLSYHFVQILGQFWHSQCLCLEYKLISRISLSYWGNIQDPSYCIHPIEE